MYRDAAEWSEIRNRIIEQDMPIRQVARNAAQAARRSVKCSNIRSPSLTRGPIA